MTKFEIITDKKSKNKHRICYDGIIDVDSYALENEFPIIGTIESIPIIERIISVPINILEKDIARLELQCGLDLSDDDSIIFITPLFPGENLLFIIDINASLEYWDKSYSVHDYWKMIIDEYKLLDTNIIELDSSTTPKENFLDNMQFSIKILDKSRTLDSYLDEFYPIISDIITNAEKRLLQPKNSFSVEFNFPNEIKAPCEQYLMYFAQFMMDLGIEVENEISHKDHETIFSVIPENKDEALGNIKDALSAYLNLPQENITPTFEPTKDIAVAQLEFNVTNLKSQLQLVQSTMIAYEHTIQAQKIALDAFQIKEQSNTLLTPKAPEKEDDIEPVFGNLFQVKKYDKNGVVIDYPELVRALKRKFS